MSWTQTTGIRLINCVSVCWRGHAGSQVFRSCQRRRVSLQQLSEDNNNALFRIRCQIFNSCWVWRHSAQFRSWNQKKDSNIELVFSVASSQKLLKTDWSISWSLLLHFFLYERIRRLIDYWLFGGESALAHCLMTFRLQFSAENPMFFRETDILWKLEDIIFK